MTGVEPSRDWISYVADCESPLQVVIVGMNPSDESWKSVAPYANKRNSLWRVLQEAKFGRKDEMVPANFKRLASTRGIGFCDLFVVNETDSAKVGRGVPAEDVAAHFLRRLQGALRQPPRVIALVCKNVCDRLLNLGNTSRLSYGKLGRARDFLPCAWLPESVELWLLPCTSGRASQISLEAKITAFSELAAYLDDL